MLSLIVPCYNEQEALPFFMDAIDGIPSQAQLVGKDLEIIFVDDGDLHTRTLALAQIQTAEYFKQVLSMI